MICQDCGFDNPARQLFCTRCGAKIDLDFEDVEELLQREVHGERADATSQQVHQYLLIGGFILAISLLLRGCVASNPAQPDVLPKLESPMDVLPERTVEPIDPIFPLPIPND